jgi:hypothetical protein
MSQFPLKITQQKAEILLESTGAMNETIVLADLKGAYEELDGTTQSVNIHEVKYSILPTDEILISRNGQIVARLTNSGTISFTGSRIDINNTHDLVITSGGIAPGAFLVISLSKVGGYLPTVPNLGV